MIRVLIADDEKNIRRVLTAELSESGYDVAEAENGDQIIAITEKDDFDVILLDLNMPGLSGMEVLKKIKSVEMPAEVIILTGHGTVSAAVEAMKLGAYDFITKPFKIEELKAVISKAFEKRKILGENLLLKTQLKRQSAEKVIVTANPAMLALLEITRKVAASEFPVLIYGESGVGKELIAWTVHRASDRAEGPFVAINCGAIPDSMIESELFGHEKGAFTGAYARKLGLLEIANSGTLFLDEIGDLPIQLQVKLLRVIETKSFYRVGGVKEIKVDVKFVAASNKDLKAEEEKGAFRHDLYYRMTALTLHVPPLRERREDIPLLVDHFLKKNPANKDRKIDPKAMNCLTEYAWPGNVRELQNVVHRMLLLSRESTITREDLPADLFAGRKIAGRKLEDVEREHILKILREVDGQKGRAAEILGIDPKTLYRKLAQYG